MGVRFKPDPVSGVLAISVGYRAASARPAHPSSPEDVGEKSRRAKSIFLRFLPETAEQNANKSASGAGVIDRLQRG
jgi:hypothetical protein